MAFKYINPGFGDLFDEASPKCVQYQNNNYSRTSGDCFRLLEGNGVNTHTLFLENAKDYWGTFYFYPVGGSNSSATIFSFLNSIYGINLKQYFVNNTSFYFQFENNEKIVYGARIDRTFYFNKGYHIEVYVKDDQINGAINMWVNGERVFEFYGKTGNGNGFNKASFGTDNNYVSYFSDIVIQNTGRIGDKRIAKLNYDDIYSDLNYYDVPIGYDIQVTNFLSVNKSFIFNNLPFKADGKLKEVTVAHFDEYYGGITSTNKYSFFVLRANSSGTYDITSKSNEYIFVHSNRENSFYNCFKTFRLTVPIEVKKGDYFGYYVANNAEENRSGIYITPVDKCKYFVGDITKSSTVDLRTFTDYNYVPCMWFLFETTNKSIAIDQMLENNRLNKQINSNVGVYTENKDVIFARNTLQNNLKIGKIESIAISSNAHYEGDTLKGLSSIMKSGDNVVEGEKINFTTEDSNKILSIYDKNPFTNNSWDIDDLKDLNIGIKTKE